MMCPACGQETPLTRSFCMHCGDFLQLGEAAVRESMLSDLQSEGSASLVRRTGAWLATSLVLFAAALAFRMMYRESTLPLFEETLVVDLLTLEPAPPLPTTEIPALALGVPGAPP